MAIMFNRNSSGHILTWTRYRILVYVKVLEDMLTTIGELGYMDPYDT